MESYNKHKNQYWAVPVVLKNMLTELKIDEMGLIWELTLQVGAPVLWR